MTHTASRSRPFTAVLAIALVVATLCAAASAAPPATIPFQGALTKPSGAAVADGGYGITLRLYDQVQGGTALWTETKLVAVTRGVFSTPLGDTTPFPATLTFDRPYYLGVQLPGDAEMTPRVRLGAVPYAHVALGGAASSDAASPLSGLSRERAGRARQAGSRDTGGGNHDYRSLDPGQTITLLDVSGSGVVQRFWCTIAPRADMHLHRQAILRMYWDGETSPSVEAPIGDFFGVGFGQQVDYTSLPLNETSGGYNCYWEMPFRTGARWTLTNMSAKRMDAFYYNIDYTAYDALPSDRLRFHAQWRRENPTTPAKNYTILEATGRGHYAGTALFMQNRTGNGLGFLEGDEMMFVDGETTPSISGTGAEDYFSSGWYYDRGPYSAPYHGCVIKDTTLGRISTYRWHIEDAKPFDASLRVTIEHGTNNDTEADYSSVAYWYQSEPHGPFPSLPTDPALLLPFETLPPFKIPNAIEGESLVATATASSGQVSVQEMLNFGTGWSGNQQLWWRPTSAGATLMLHVPITTGGAYALTAYFTKAKDYGIVQAKLGAANVGAALNLYAPNVVPTGAVSLGTVALSAGDNVLTLQVTGKDAASTDYMVGLDAFLLEAE